MDVHFYLQFTNVILLLFKTGPMSLIKVSRLLIKKTEKPAVYLVEESRWSIGSELFTSGTLGTYPPSVISLIR